MHHVSKKNCPGIYIQHLFNAICCVVFEKFFSPFYGMVIGLADSSKISGNGVRPSKVNITSIGSPGIKGFHIGGTDDLHGKCSGNNITIIFNLLSHIPDPDNSARHEFFFFNGLSGLDHEPWEKLHCTYFKGHCIGGINKREICIFSQNVLAIIIH